LVGSSWLKTAFSRLIRCDFIRGIKRQTLHTGICSVERFVYFVYAKRCAVLRSSSGGRLLK
jgi:hypothetical protein